MVVGGSGFMGRLFVERSVKRGDRVWMLNRGTPGIFPAGTHPKADPASYHTPLSFSGLSDPSFMSAESMVTTIKVQPPSQPYFLTLTLTLTLTQTLTLISPRWIVLTPLLSGRYSKHASKKPTLHSHPHP